MDCCIVMGRHTLAKVLTFGVWPYGHKKVVVLSSQPLSIPANLTKTVTHDSRTPADILARLVATGARHLYIDGGRTIRQFLAAGAIRRLIITRIPVLIGQGIPLFGPLPMDIRLHHVATRQYPSGLVQSEYMVGG